MKNTKKYLSAIITLTFSILTSHQLSAMSEVNGLTTQLMATNTEIKDMLTPLIDKMKPGSFDPKEVAKTLKTVSQSMILLEEKINQTRITTGLAIIQLNTAINTIKPNR